MWLPLALALVLAEPGPTTAVAIQWRAPVDDELRGSLRDSIAARDGRLPAAIIDDAFNTARRAVARELPIELRELRAQLRERLDRADEGFRAARFDEALGELEIVRELLRATPTLPGAVTSLREVELLTAKIAWARAELDRADAALRTALRLDPEAQWSAREAAPALVERYAALQSELLGAAATWPTPEIVDLGPGAELEIDGVPGSRPVPPGEHLLTLHHDGHEPRAAWHDIAQPWHPPTPTPRLPDDPEQALAEICEILALDQLVLAERREDRIGVQVHECGGGFGPLWVGELDGLERGLDQAFAGPFDEPAASLDGEWPTPPLVLEQAPTELPRPWYRRPWVWGTSTGVAAVVVGAVVTGVVLGGRGRARPAIEIDADSFIGAGY